MRYVGTYVNWELDAMFISQRAAHLHKTYFLKLVDKAGGLNRLKHLAINDQAWEERRWVYGDTLEEFKRYNQVGSAQQLSDLETLTIVCKSGS